MIAICSAERGELPVDPDAVDYSEALGRIQIVIDSLRGYLADTFGLIAGLPLYTGFLSGLLLVMLFLWADRR